MLAALYAFTGYGGPGSGQAKGVLGQGASGGVGRLVHVQWIRGPGSGQATGGLGRGASGCVGRLVHVHRIRGAWFRPGDGVLDGGHRAVLAAL